MAVSTWCAYFQIVNDVERESVREQFTVSLVVLGGPVTISPLQGSATVTIVDDDGGEFPLSLYKYQRGHKNC